MGSPLAANALRGACLPVLGWTARRSGRARRWACSCWTFRLPNYRDAMRCEQAVGTRRPRCEAKVFQDGASQLLKENEKVMYLFLLVIVSAWLSSQLLSSHRKWAMSTDDRGFSDI